MKIKIDSILAKVQSQAHKQESEQSKNKSRSTTGGEQALQNLRSQLQRSTKKKEKNRTAQSNKNRKSASKE